MFIEQTFHEPYPTYRSTIHTMARPTDVSARNALLDAVVEYLGRHGLAETTLRPMAAELGTTATRLLHHFGTKEELITAALERVDATQRQLEARWTARSPGLSQSDILRQWWKWLLNSEKNRQLARLGLEAALLDTTVTGLPTEIRASRMGAWRVNIERRLIASGIPAPAARVQSSVLEAGFTGLMLDLLSGGERRRLTQALESLLADHELRIDTLRRSS
jgi:AcrR family transcriptional regulator